MQPGDHTPALERIAAESGRTPPEVLEFYIERVGIRSECMPIGAAEEWAVEDCRAYFAISSRLSAPRAEQVQPSSTCERAADASVLRSGGRES